MKQRFSISRNTAGQKIVIKEYAELDKGAYSLLCEESYAAAAVEAALEKEPQHLIALLRTESFFPTSYFVEKLTVYLRDYITQGGSEPVIIDVDDSECIRGTNENAPEESSAGIDALLEVDHEDLVDDEAPVGKLDAPIKIAEDETAEISNSL